VARYKMTRCAARLAGAGAHLSGNKTSQPMQAIAVLRKLDEIFQGKDGLQALLKAEKTGPVHGQGLEVSIEINERIIAAYPDHDDA